MEKGIDAPEIIHDTFYEKTYNQNQILGRALLREYPSPGWTVHCNLCAAERDGILWCKTERSGRNRKSACAIQRSTKVAIFMYELKLNEYQSQSALE